MMSTMLSSFSRKWTRNAHWGITICDPDMLLGVERKLTVEDGYNFTVTKDMADLLGFTTQYAKRLTN